MKLKLNLNFVVTLSAVFLVSFLFFGCARPVGKTRFPEPSNSYTPKSSYSVSFDTMWNAIDDVLQRNRIGIVSSDKSSGTILTDYIQGQSQVNALGLAGSITTRYKYNIRSKPINNNKSKLSIFCTLESSGNSLTSWRNISNDNKALVSNLEKWLYEQIEKELN